MTQYQEVMTLLVKHNITQKEIAARAGVKPAAVSIVVHGKSRSCKIESIITELTGYQFPPFKQVPRTLSAANN